MARENKLDLKIFAYQLMHIHANDISDPPLSLIETRDGAQPCNRCSATNIIY
jgi:hypothetical protein